MSKKIAIVGSGNIGRSWAIVTLFFQSTQVFIRAGYQACLYDSIEGATENAIKLIEKDLGLLNQHNLLKGRTIEQCISSLSTASTLKSALSGAIYAQESAPENLELKLKIFQEIDEVVGPDTIVGSSTSNIPSSKFTENLKNRSRYLVVHPVNPPHAIPLVELVPAPWTDPKAVDEVKKLLSLVGQQPVVLKKEIIGFLVNRVQYALLAESLRLVEDDVASPEDIDKVVSEGLGKRWSFLGPFSTADLNHPRGLTDLKEIYMPGVRQVLDTQDNTRQIKEETLQKIISTWRQKYPVEDIQNMGLWRNQRLFALAKHQMEEEKKPKQ